MDQKILNSTGKNILMKEESENELRSSFQSKERISSATKDVNLGFGVIAFSAAGAAVFSAVIVNPLYVAKTRLQSQATGVPYHGLCRTTCFETNTMLPDMRCYPSCTRAVIGSESTCAPDCSWYKGTFDVFYKVTHQEGFARLWRGTYASFTLAVPTMGIYLPYDIFPQFSGRIYIEKCSKQCPLSCRLSCTLASLYYLFILLNLQEHACRHLKRPKLV